MWYYPFTTQETLNFIFFVSTCYFGIWFLTWVFTPRN